MTRRPEADFTREECRPFLLEGGDHAVLMIHGFSGSIAQLRPVADRLHQHGYTVRGFNLPGHASRMEDMACCTWQEWLHTAKAEFAALKERCPNVSVVGHSMGGVLAMLLAQQMDVAAVVPIAAPTAVQSRLLPFARFASPFVKNIWWPVRNDGEAKSPYNLGYPGFPTRSAAELNVLIRMARRNLHAITCPILVVQSRRDETIVPESAETILKGVSSAKKGVMWLVDAPHLCTIGKDVDRIALAACELLASV